MKAYYFNLAIFSWSQLLFYVQCYFVVRTEWMEEEGGRVSCKYSVEPSPGLHLVYWRYFLLIFLLVNIQWNLPWLTSCILEVFLLIFLLANSQWNLSMAYVYNIGGIRIYILSYKYSVEPSIDLNLKYIGGILI